MGAIVHLVPGTYEGGEDVEEGQDYFEEDFALDLFESSYLTKCSCRVLKERFAKKH